ncbi:hypothetical protein [Catellatospora chokoriensis]|uniref:Uncharacterized protein n=1 Tax=Catellatospora chokoriensis TaxID=310353 RepID=A0A8J3K339_9ACTN|nr:hypothetical protein [Catellatospora chokoriensis]GIF92191.1 hypothetical protein Cch02nite_56350 [Catellatospora chokoriensis]
MRISWRAAVGGLAGLVGAVTWAISSAVYQPIMEPSGVWYDEAGVAVQQTAENNTYWPRELRHLAILLAVAGILVLCRTASRAVATAVVAAGGWLTADVLLDRFDVHGTGTAIVLASAATAYVATAAFLASRLSRADTGGPAVRHVVAGTLALLAVTSLLVVTPWVEQTTPAQIRAEAELTALKIVVSVLFAVLAATTVGRPAARAGATLGFGLVAVAAGVFVAVGEYRFVYSYALLIAVVAALVAVAAPRVRSVAGLVGMTVLGAVCAVASFAVLIIGGMVVGSVLTSLAGNPPVNGADTDISAPLLVTVLGVAMSLLTLAVTALPGALRAVQAGPPGSPAAAG